MFQRNGIGPIIRTNGTVFWSILYLNSDRVYIRLIYVYSVISVNDKRLPGNTKKWTLVRSWLIRVRLVHSWADICMHIQFVELYTCIHMHTHMRWLRLVGSLKLHVPFAKEPYKRDDILQMRPIILRRLRIVATP